MFDLFLPHEAVTEWIPLGDRSALCAVLQLLYMGWAVPIKHSYNWGPKRRYICMDHPSGAQALMLPHYVFECVGVWPGSRNETQACALTATPGSEWSWVLHGGWAAWGEACLRASVQSLESELPCCGDWDLHSHGAHSHVAPWRPAMGLGWNELGATSSMVLNKQTNKQNQFFLDMKEKSISYPLFSSLLLPFSWWPDMPVFSAELVLRSKVVPAYGSISCPQRSSEMLLWISWAFLHYALADSLRCPGFFSGLLLVHQQLPGLVFLWRDGGWAIAYFTILALSHISK